MELANLSLTSIKLCSPVIIFMVYVIVSCISLFMTRNTLKKFKNQRMENLYDLYSWNEIKLIIVLGVVIYGLCQYDQMNLAWIYLMFPIIYIMLKNVFVFAYVSIAHQNAPKGLDPSDLFKKIQGKESPGSIILPEAPIVKKEIDTTIFGMRGDQDGALKTQQPVPTVAMNSTSIDNLPQTNMDSLEGWSSNPGGNGLDAFFNNGV